MSPRRISRKKYIMIHVNNNEIDNLQCVDASGHDNQIEEIL